MKSEPTVTSRLISVAIVDDHFVVRNGLMATFEIEPEFKVIGAADSGAAILDSFLRWRPDVVLLDLQLPGIAGADLISALLKQDPRARILLFSAYCRDDEIMASLDAGAMGYVKKSAPRQELLTALRVVGNGGKFLTPELARRMRELRCGPVITPREREIVGYVAQGKSNKEIAQLMSISPETVKDHVSSLLAKLGVTDRAQAAAEAIRRGVLSLDDQ